MFCSLNRFLGFPNRIFVTNRVGIKNLINLYSGNRPCFVSVARYSGVDEEYMSYFPFDFDSLLGLRIPFKDTRKLVNFFSSHDIPHKVVVSGGKGFHCYFEFQETKVTPEVYNKIYSIQHSLKKYLNLQATDTPLFGKHHLMIRIPTTPYVSKKLINGEDIYAQNGNYCRYLTDDEFLSGLNKIKKYMLEPGIMPKQDTSLPSIDDLVDLIPNFKLRKKSDGSLNIDIVSDGVLKPTLESVGLPCLKQIALSDSPSHPERIELVAWLKLLGYRDMAILSFIRTLSWKKFSVSKTAKQLATIKARFPKCSMLREKNPEQCKNCSLYERNINGNN